MSKYSRLFTYGCSFTHYEYETDVAVSSLSQTIFDEDTEIPRLGELRNITNYVRVIQKCWPEYLGEILETPVVNHGQDGTSNEHIIQKIIDDYDLLSSSKDGLVVIGMTEITRNLLNGKMIRDYDPRTKRMVYRFYTQIITMQSVLEKIGIPYKIFAALNPLPNIFDDMEFIKHVMNHPRFDTVDNGTLIGFPFMKEVGGFSLQSWNKKNDKSYHTSDAHPTSKAHKEFAKILGNNI